MNLITMKTYVNKLYILNFNCIHMYIFLDFYVVPFTTAN